MARREGGHRRRTVGWLIVMKGMDATSAIVVAFTSGMLPFILGDIIKAILAALGVQLTGWPARIALTVGLGLSTISEFGYVLGSEAARLKFVPTELLELFIVVAVGTMLVGALLVPLSARVAMLAARA